MRNKFVYSCSVNIRASGFNGLFKSIFCIPLLVEAFCVQKVVEMLEEVVVSWWEVRWIRRMMQNFVAQFNPLLKHWLCDLWLGIVVENWGPFLLTNAGCRCCSFRCIASIWWAHFSDVMVSPGFRKLSQVRRAADHKATTVSFLGASLTLGSALELLLGPITELVIAGCHRQSRWEMFAVVEYSKRKQQFFWFVVSSWDINLSRFPPF